ncbi:hypothetical protein ES705_24285 [subsurface metagenome]
MPRKPRYFEVLDGRTGNLSYLVTSGPSSLRMQLGEARFNELRVRRLHPRTGTIFGSSIKSPYWPPYRYKSIADLV